VVVGPPVVELVEPEVSVEPVDSAVVVEPLSDVGTAVLDVATVEGAVDTVDEDDGGGG
jgi:hypothetical protein